MSILVRFMGAPSMTAEAYDTTLGLVQASGDSPPTGFSCMSPLLPMGASG